MSRTTRYPGGALSASRCEGDLLRSTKVPIPREQRNLVNDARGPDQLVGGVATDVQTGARSRDIGRDRPKVYGPQNPQDLPIVEINLDPPELGELRYLPHDDSGDRPWLTTQQLAFPLCQLSRYCVKEDVRIKIQHASVFRST